jgi:hopene-associated glycosyltransferase HpnB
MILTVVAALAWAYLIIWHGKFWQAGPILPASRPAAAPAVAIVVPARDEAETIDDCLRSLLAQDYPGPLSVILVDDGSTDGTGTIARAIADPRLCVLTGQKRPAGWSGKLWAVAQGVDAIQDGATHVLLTDADIIHDAPHLASLMAKAMQNDLDLVSEMVELRCRTWPERALVPAFVYFFQLLYPFAWANDPLRGNAAAAGGTILLHRRALARIGGIEAVRGALIDDVALATAVKRGGRIWLGHSRFARSLRPYPNAGEVWRMIARTAYVQLHHSPLLLVGTVLGLALVFLVPPLWTLFGHGWGRALAGGTWVALAASYLPTLRRFGLSPLWAPFLPLVACFYMAATIGSAVDHHAGRGVRWKGRAYSGAG